MITTKPHYDYVKMRIDNIVLHKRFTKKDLQKLLKTMFKQTITFEELQPQRDNTLLFNITINKIQYKILINYLFDLKDNLFITGYEIN